MMQQTGVGRGAEPRARALLIYTDRGLQREVALQRTPFTVGRLAGRDLVLDAPYVSRQHAEDPGARRRVCPGGSGEQGRIFVMAGG